MAKELLNEAEQYLLQNWAEARELEKAMEGVRGKYKAVFQRIVRAVAERHKELTVWAIQLGQSWNGCIGFSRNTWPGSDSQEPSGLWVDRLNLHLLATEDSKGPISYIWVAKNANIDLVAARLEVNKALNELLTLEERKEVVLGAAGEPFLLHLPAPSKRELLAALLEGDGEGFVKLFIPPFDMMARFVPVLDTVFRDYVIKE